MHNRYTLLISLALASLPVPAQNTTEGDVPDGDQTPATPLREVVVTGQDVWMEGNKVVFRPKKSAKNLATDATSLIQRMNTGLLFVENGAIKSRNGRDVAIFINGVKADGLDLSTFWPKNAIRVEYIEASDDPRFAGYDNVVNFVMKEYVTGGLTKVSADQEFPNNGDYSIASKLVYKRMTYNAIFAGGYSRDHITGTEKNEQYSDVWYNGTHYDLIEREQRSDDVKRDDRLYGGLNARYRHKNTSITHTVGLQWTRNPESYSHGYLRYTPEIIDANSMYSLTHARSLSPVVSGDYEIGTNGKFGYKFNWNFQHTHNNNLSEYSEMVIDPIINRVRENLYNYSAGATISYGARRNMGFVLHLEEVRVVSTSDYSGTTVSHQWQQVGQSKISLQWKYMPIQKVYIAVTPGIELQDWNVNHTYKKTSWLPRISGDVYYTINNTNSLNLHAFYFLQSPASSMRNDLILRQTELIWLEGNPTMKSGNYQSYSIGWYTRPLNWLSSNASVSYSSDNNAHFVNYRSGGTTYDGVIGEYVAAGKSHNFGLFWYLAASLLDGKINLSNSLQYNFAKWDAAGTPKVGYWYTRPSVSWYFGNCSLTASYNSPQKYVSDGGTVVNTLSHQYELQFSYGNGNLNLDVTLTNPFKKHLTGTEYFVSGPYSYQANNWNRGRCLGVSLTYTFDYGKKVTPGVEIYEQNVKSTNVLGTDKE